MKKMKQVMAMAMIATIAGFGLQCGSDPQIVSAVLDTGADILGLDSGVKVDGALLPDSSKPDSVKPDAKKSKPDVLPIGADAWAGTDAGQDALVIPPKKWVKVIDKGNLVAGTYQLTHASWSTMDPPVIQCWIKADGVWRQDVAVLVLSPGTVDIKYGSGNHDFVCTIMMEI